MPIDCSDSLPGRSVSGLPPCAPGEIGVPLRVDGSSYLAGLHLTGAEHLRRRHLGLGAASSRALLHALWSLPHGVPVPWDSISDLDRVTLLEEGSGWVIDDGRTALRTYQPAGAVGSVVVTDGSLSRAVSRVAAHPPTFRRMALWRRESTRPPQRHLKQLDRAEALGIGVYTMQANECIELVTPAPAVVGLPAVFRWWIAEIAYRNWLMRIGPIARA
jgi:hypothetical protein